MENAKKNLVFHFGGGRHASVPQKPVVKALKIKEKSVLFIRRKMSRTTEETIGPENTIRFIHDFFFFLSFEFLILDVKVSCQKLDGYRFVGLW